MAVYNTSQTIFVPVFPICSFHHREPYFELSLYRHYEVLRVSETSLNKRAMQVQGRNKSQYHLCFLSFLHRCPLYLTKMFTLALHQMEFITPNIKIHSIAKTYG